MTTFTLGLGLDGQLKFDPNYKSQTIGDYADLRSGVKGWPNPNPGSANTSNANEQRRGSTTCGTRRSTAGASTSARRTRPPRRRR